MGAEKGTADLIDQTTGDWINGFGEGITNDTTSF